MPCQCTEIDFECDVNFIKDIDGKCIPIKNNDMRNEQLINIESEDCEATGYYMTTTGYRKIAGDTC